MAMRAVAWCVSCRREFGGVQGQYVWLCVRRAVGHGLHQRERMFPSCS